MVFKVRLTVLLFVGCLVFNPLCGAIVRGRVTDTAGKTLQDAKVLFQNLNTSGKVKLKSNKRGEFQASVPAGAYRVLVEKEGYKATMTRVTLGTLGGAPTLRFKLESGKRGVFAFELSKDELQRLQRKQKKQVAQRQASASATRFFFEGKKLMGMGEFLEAAKSFEKAAKAKPDGVQIWEQLVQAEFQLATCIEQIVRQRVQVVFRTKDDDEISRPALVPHRAVFRFVGESKGNGIFVWNEIETTVFDLGEHSLFGQQPVRVGYQREPRDVLLKVLEDCLSPISHLLPPPVRQQQPGFRERPVPVARDRFPTFAPLLRDVSYETAELLVGRSDSMPAVEPEKRNAPSHAHGGFAPLGG